MNKRDRQVVADYIKEIAKHEDWTWLSAKPDPDDDIEYWRQRCLVAENQLQREEPDEKRS